MIEIKPKKTIDADVTVPGSKSITNRALVAAALADGMSTLHNALISDDTRYMLEALKHLGIQSIENDKIIVTGCAGKLPAADHRTSNNEASNNEASNNEAPCDEAPCDEAPCDEATRTAGESIYVGNAGTAMRFLTAMLTLGRGIYTIDGNERMRERPIRDLLDGLAQLGADAASVHANGCPPVRVKGAGLRGGKAVMPGNVSSQFFSAILLAAPYAATDVEITAHGELVSKPYIDMTIALMRDFGAQAARDGNRMTITAGAGYKSREYVVECDASSASYFFAAAAVTGGRVGVNGLSRDSMQGDVRFVDALAQMGCEVKSDADGKIPYIEVQGRPLKGIDIDMGDISDVALTLAVTAVFAEGSTRITNVANMRYKETDRIAALATELRRIGQEVEELPDGLVIHPKPVKPAVIHTYDDHRMAMSFSLAGLRQPGIVISNPECVSKTFPDFFERFQAL